MGAPGDQVKMGGATESVERTGRAIGGWTWDQVGLTGSTDPLQPSLVSRRPHQLLGWSQRPNPCSPTSPSRSLGFAGPSYPRHRAEPEPPTPSLPLSSALLSSRCGRGCFSPSALTARAAGTANLDGGEAGRAGKQRIRREAGLMLIRSDC